MIPLRDSQMKNESWLNYVFQAQPEAAKTSVRALCPTRGDSLHRPCTFSPLPFRVSTQHNFVATLWSLLFPKLQFASIQPASSFLPSLALASGHIVSFLSKTRKVPSIPLKSLFFSSLNHSKKMEGSQFIMFCQFQVLWQVIQLYIYIFPFFFRFFSKQVYYRMLSRVPCAVQ